MMQAVPWQPHDFKDHNYLTVTLCNYCGDVMWGFSSQGLQCSACYYNCHHDCRLKVQNCHVNTPPLLEVEHNFVTQSFTRPTYCNLCRSLLHGVVHQGLKCTVCTYISHTSCSQKVPKCCRVDCAALSDRLQEKSNHHWVEGNLAQSSSCAVCKKSCYALCLINFMCAWCKKSVHSSCLDAFPKYCDFGALAQSIIPPYSVSKTDGASPCELLPHGLPPKPLFVFVNPKSGGQQGNALMVKLRSLLNGTVQVYSLIPGGPSAGLNVIKSFLDKTGYKVNRIASPHVQHAIKPAINFAVPQVQNLNIIQDSKVIDLRVLVCGGDGTAGWVLQEMAKMGLEVPVGIIPLGTGNDLARTFGWGGGYTGGRLPPLLHSIEEAAIRTLDRWSISITPFQDGVPIPPSKIMTNYFSIGVDAKVALNFHLQREAYPDQFKNRFINKLWYTTFGAQALFDGCEKLNLYVMVEIDGKQLELPTLEGIIVVNLPSYAAGNDLWGVGELPSSMKPQAIDDNTLEVLGVEGSGHLGQIQAGLSHGMKLGQGSVVKIAFNKEPYPVQLDGEPWMQAPSSITISLRDQVPMLAHRHVE